MSGEEPGCPRLGPCLPGLPPTPTILGAPARQCRSRPGDPPPLLHQGTRVPAPCALAPLPAPWSSALPTPPPAHTHTVCSHSPTHLLTLTPCPHSSTRPHQLTHIHTPAHTHTSHSFTRHTCSHTAAHTQDDSPLFMLIYIPAGAFLFSSHSHPHTHPLTLIHAAAPTFTFTGSRSFAHTGSHTPTLAQAQPQCLPGPC